MPRPEVKRLWRHHYLNGSVSSITTSTRGIIEIKPAANTVLTLKELKFAIALSNGSTSGAGASGAIGLYFATQSVNITAEADPADTRRFWRPQPFMIAPKGNTSASQIHVLYRTVRWPKVILSEDDQLTLMVKVQQGTVSIQAMMHALTMEEDTLV